MSAERIEIRVIGELLDGQSRRYAIIAVRERGGIRRLVVQGSAFASPGRFRSYLSSLGVVLVSDAREVKRALESQPTPPGSAPSLTVHRHLGWVERPERQPVFLLDEGYVDEQGWHDTMHLDGEGPHHRAVGPGQAEIVSDAALWRPEHASSVWVGYDQPPKAPMLTGWRHEGCWEDWAAWFSGAPRLVRTVVCAALAPVALRGVARATERAIVVGLVGRPGALGVLQAGVSPWADPRDGLFWPDARLQDLEDHAARMGELPLAFQEVDATSTNKLHDLVQQYATGRTKARAQGASSMRPTYPLRGTLLLESAQPIMTPSSSMQDATLQFACEGDVEQPAAHGVAGPRLVEAVLRRSERKTEHIQGEFDQLCAEFRARRIELGFEPSRTWRLDARHAAVELTHRVLVRELGIVGEFEHKDGMVTEWRKPMMAAGIAEAGRKKRA